MANVVIAMYRLRPIQLDFGFSTIAHTNAVQYVYQ